MASTVASIEPSGSFVKRMIFFLGLLVFLLALEPKFLRHAESFQKNPFLFLELAYHHFLPLTFPEFLLELMLLKLFELLQFIQKVQFAFFMGFDVVHSDFVGLFCIFFLEVLTLHLIQNLELLNSARCTLSFSLKDLDSSSTLWFIRVMTIFLLYLRWSLMSLLNSALRTWPSSFFFFSLVRNQILRG